MLDVEQCRPRFSVPTQIESIFAETPSYKPRRLSAVENNMTTAELAHDHGLNLAHLGSDFNTMFEQGIALLSPAGVLLKPVLPPGDNEHNKDPHDPVVVKEDMAINYFKQRMRWKSNSLPRLSCWTLKGKGNRSSLCSMCCTMMDIHETVGRASSKAPARASPCNPL